MKGFIICAIRLVLLILLANESITKSIYNISMYESIDSIECTKTKFDVREHDYIQDQFRYDLCKAAFKEYDSEEYMTNNIECLGPNCNYNVYLNPCSVECVFPNPPNTLSFGSNGDFYDSEYYSSKTCVKEESCDYFKRNYYKREIRIKDTTQQCGPKHYCDSNGCCVERVMTSSTAKTPINSQTPTSVDITTKNSITSRITTSETNTNSATNIRTSTPFMTTTASTTTPTPAISWTPIQSTQQTSIPMCQSIGLFKYPNDKTNRKFIKCELKAQQLVCPLGQTFDQQLSRCTPEAHTIPIAPTTTASVTQELSTQVQTSTHIPSTDWSKYIKCTEEGFFENPYKCTEFYRCYKNDEIEKLLSIAFFKCPPNQWFDNQKKTCITESEYINRNGTCIDKPLPTSQYDLI